DLRANTRSFAQVGAFRYWLFNLSGQEGPEAVLGVFAGDDVIEALRVRPAYGTSFTRGADNKGHPREVLLSFGLWKRRYGSAPAVVGTSILVDGAPATVIGVLPRGFRFPELMPANTPLPSREPDVYMPVGTEAQGHDDRGNDNYWVVGRLAPGVTQAQAGSELDAFARHQAAAFPNTDANLSMVPRPLK